MVCAAKGNNKPRVVVITIVPIVILIFLIISICIVLRMRGKKEVIGSKSMILLASLNNDSSL